MLGMASKVGTTTGRRYDFWDQWNHSVYAEQAKFHCRRARRQAGNHPAVCGKGAHHPMGKRLFIPMGGFLMHLQLGFLIGATEERALPSTPQLTWKSEDPVWVSSGPSLQ